MIRCKFKCESVTPNGDGVSILLRPVVSGSPENEEFFMYTPWGSLEIGTINMMAAEVIVPGQEYYIDISPEAESKNLTLGHALEWLKLGKKVAREGWNGKGMWIALMPPLQLPARRTPGNVPKVNERTARFIGEDTPLDSQPYIAMWTAQGKWQPGWLASQADMLADDWMVV